MALDDIIDRAADAELVDGIVESSMEGFILKLKVDYQKELRRALLKAVGHSRRRSLAMSTSHDEARGRCPVQGRGKETKTLRQAGHARPPPDQEPAAPSGAAVPQLIVDADGGGGQPRPEQHSPTGFAHSPGPERHSPRQQLGTGVVQFSQTPNVVDPSESSLPGMTVPDAHRPTPSPSVTADRLPSPYVTPAVTVDRLTITDGEVPGLDSATFRNWWHPHSSDLTQGSPSTPGGSRRGLLSEGDLEVIKEIQNEKRKRNLKAEAKGNPRWGFHRMRSKAITESQKRAFDIVTSRFFDLTMGAVILLNSASIGAETHITVHGDEIPTSMVVIEYIFLVVYVVELCLRLHAVGVKQSLSSNWIKFDAVLVGSGLLSFVLTMVSLGTGTEASLGGGPNMNVLKMLRLVRLARTVRLVVQFRTLWRLVQGLMHAFLPMLWTCLTMMMVVYVFAILGMEMIVGSSGEALSQEAQGNFHSIGGSILTFMQMMALDSSAGIYRPLIEANAVLSILFLAFFMIGPIALMSIVTAIMVESSMRTATEDMEAKKAWENDKMQKTRRSIVPKLRTLLETLDTDCSGDVVLEELLMAPKELQDQVAHICDLETLEEVFHVLDVDGNGAVDIDELVNGIIPRSRISSCSHFSSK